MRAIHDDSIITEVLRKASDSQREIIVVCRIRNWRLDSLDGVNAVACTGIHSACGATFEFGTPTDNSVSVIGAANGCQVLAQQSASAGSSTLSVPLSVDPFTTSVCGHPVVSLALPVTSCCDACCAITSTVISSISCAVTRLIINEADSPS